MALSSADESAAALALLDNASLSEMFNPEEELPPVMTNEDGDDDLVTNSILEAGSKPETVLVSHIPMASKVSIVGTHSAGSSVVSNTCPQQVLVAAQPPPCDPQQQQLQQQPHQESLDPSLTALPVAPDSESLTGERISSTQVEISKSTTTTIDSTDNGTMYGGRKVSLDDVDGSYDGGPPTKKARSDTSNESLVATANVTIDTTTHVNIVPAPVHAATNPLPTLQQPLQQQPVVPTLPLPVPALPAPPTQGGRSVLLLSQPTDTAVLSPLHVFVRQQVEVFTATEEDITQPAPGRKNRIQLHQVGLRCIHCRDLPPRDRVKRAVCYPSSVGRVYHSVSDMKFDHFTHCKGLPDDVRAKFVALKQEAKQKRPKQQGGAASKAATTPSYLSSSTAQCYHDSACQMGMVDADGGLFMAKDVLRKSQQLFRPQSATTKGSGGVAGHAGAPAGQIPILPKNPSGMVAMDDAASNFAAASYAAAISANNPLAFVLPKNGMGDNDTNSHNNAMMSSLASYLYTMNGGNNSNTTPLGSSPTKNEQIVTVQTNNAAPPHLPFGPSASTSAGSNVYMAGPTASPMTTSCLLTSHMDQHHLNPLHCFVRRHIELFVANKNDIAAPAPGRKTRVVLGQVGLRCIHCANLPPKDRVKRAVCYPAAVSGIYHSVSNMKFDHFDKCRGLPEAERAVFTSLRSSCGRHGPRTGSGGSVTKGPATIATNSNSTAQYYHDSAFRLGLIDSETGMRFSNALFPSLSNGTAANGSAIAGGTATSSKPLSTTSPTHNSATDGISALMIAASVRAAVGPSVSTAAAQQPSDSDECPM